MVNTWPRSKYHFFCSVMEIFTRRTVTLTYLKDLTVLNANKRTLWLFFELSCLYRTLMLIRRLEGKCPQRKELVLLRMSRSGTYWSNSWRMCSLWRTCLTSGRKITSRKWPSPKYWREEGVGRGKNWRKTLCCNDYKRGTLCFDGKYTEYFLNYMEYHLFVLNLWTCRLNIRGSGVPDSQHGAVSGGPVRHHNDRQHREDGDWHRACTIH